jgi:hypothetical protein
VAIACGRNGSALDGDTVVLWDALTEAWAGTGHMSVVLCVVMFAGRRRLIDRQPVQRRPAESV